MTGLLKKTSGSWITGLQNRNSLRMRFLMVNIIVAIPVLALILWVNVRNRESARQEEIGSYQSALDISASRVDMFFSMLEESVISLPVNNSEFLDIAVTEETDTEFWILNRQLYAKVENQISVSEAEFEIFVYFPLTDVCYNDKINGELTQIILEKISEKEENSLNGGWELVSVGDTDYFLRILDYGRYYIGAWMEEENIYDLLDLTEEERARYSFQRDEEPSGSSSVTVASSVERIGCSLVYEIDTALLESALPGIGSGVLPVVAVFLILFAFYNFYIRRWVLSPMEDMEKSMKRIQAGDMAYRIPENREYSMEYVLVTQQFNSMMDQLEKLKIEIYENQLEQQEIRLQYLSQQIQPHFILNSLNTLYNYSEKDTETAREIIRLISQYYRYVVNVNSRYVKLGQELEHIDHYLAIQKIRYPSAFTYDIRCEDALEIVPVPPFLIESFISNAVKYGRKPGKSVCISIEVEEIEKFCIRIRISDTGDGFPEDFLEDIREYPRTGEWPQDAGVGIRNSVERLRLIYQERAEIRFYNREMGGAVVEIQIRLNEAT